MHPEDERYARYVGRELQVPLTTRRIRVIADDYVDREFGTGALKITPGDWVRAPRRPRHEFAPDGQ